MSKPSMPKKPKRPSMPKTKKPKVSQTKIGSFSTMTWDKVVRDAPWVSRQSMNLHPGDPAAISRYRSSKKFTARTKKVIRPRITKTVKKNTKPSTGVRSTSSWRSGGVATDRQRRSTPGGKL
jgi:hypothetical protein